jgi:hypothetical protein
VCSCALSHALNQTNFSHTISFLLVSGLFWDYGIYGGKRRNTHGRQGLTPRSRGGEPRRRQPILKQGQGARDLCGSYRAGRRAPRARVTLTLGTAHWRDPTPGRHSGRRIKPDKNCGGARGAKGVHRRLGSHRRQSVSEQGWRGGDLHGYRRARRRAPGGSGDPDPRNHTRERSHTRLTQWSPDKNRREPRRRQRSQGQTRKARVSSSRLSSRYSTPKGGLEVEDTRWCSRVTVALGLVGRRRHSHRRKSGPRR